MNQSFRNNKKERETGLEPAAPAVGPSLSGVLVDNVGWRALFAIVTALRRWSSCWRSRPSRCSNYGKFRPHSPSTCPRWCSPRWASCALLYGLSTFASTDNMALTLGLIAAGIGACGCCTCGASSSCLEHPMLQRAHPDRAARTPRLGHRHRPRAGGASWAAGVITPLYVQGALGFTATMSGVAMLPGAVIGAFTGLVSRALVRPLRRCGSVVGARRHRGRAWAPRGWRVSASTASFINRGAHLHHARHRPAVHHDAAEHLGRELARQQPSSSMPQGLSSTHEPGGGLLRHGGARIGSGPRARSGPRSAGLRAGLPGRAHGLRHHLRAHGRGGPRHHRVRPRQAARPRRGGRHGRRARRGAGGYRRWHLGRGGGRHPGRDVGCEPHLRGGRRHEPRAGVRR